jgi:3-methylcrotonyl-CoA carboxylase alpha subunit
LVGIRRLLIANRGEIAVRVVRACRELGIAPVVAAEPADRAAFAAWIADAVVEVSSYLQVESLVGAADAAGADAVHPGYGFLSEEPAFAEAVVAAGLRWVGPPAGAMRLLADKVAARELARGAGVPIVPGSEGSDLSDDALERHARELGPPLLIKAAAGGGGRGMRAVDDLERLRPAVVAARAEASSAFGDDRVFLERRVTSARHVEVQVALDGLGNAVHFGERDCSLQRRHQKILEESPSPAVDPSLRASLGHAALAVAADAGYEGVGTAEFLLRDDGSWYFLEMNARLQVEHPVTEAVTGLDLVRIQLMVAGGEPLPVGEQDVRVNGHAIEARVYAEDPAAGFLPTGGRIELLDLPRWPGVRIDTALREGDNVTLGYDPLLAKVVAVAEDRAASLARLRAALREVTIVGVTTNLGFLIDVLSDPVVAEGRADIDWVESSWVADVPPLPDGVRAAGDRADPWVEFGDGVPPPGVVVAGAHALYRGWAYELTDERDDAPAVAPLGGSLMAPMPAGVKVVAVAAGDDVAAGQVVVTLEAMKMQLAVSVPGAGRVRAVHVRPGDSVAKGQVLLEVDET